MGERSEELSRWRYAYSSVAELARQLITAHMREQLGNGMSFEYIDVESLGLMRTQMDRLLPGAMPPSDVEAADGPEAMDVEEGPGAAADVPGRQPPPPAGGTSMGEPGASPTSPVTTHHTAAPGHVPPQSQGFTHTPGCTTPLRSRVRTLQRQRSRHQSLGDLPHPHSMDEDLESASSSSSPVRGASFDSSPALPSGGEVPDWGMQAGVQVIASLGHSVHSNHAAKAAMDSESPTLDTECDTEDLALDMPSLAPGVDLPAAMVHSSPALTMEQASLGTPRHAPDIQAATNPRPEPHNNQTHSRNRQQVMRDLIEDLHTWASPSVQGLPHSSLAAQALHQATQTPPVATPAAAAPTPPRTQQPFDQAAIQQLFRRMCQQTMQASASLNSSNHGASSPLHQGNSQNASSQTLNENLVQFFIVLLSNFYFQVFIWIYLNVMMHPRSVMTRNRLKFMAFLGKQSLEEVTLNVLQGYFNGFHQGRTALLQEICSVLQDVSHNNVARGAPTGTFVSAQHASWLQELSIQLGIHLNPRQMLRSFSSVVRDIVMQRIPSTPLHW